MTPDKQQILELLKFELKFLEDGGYGRSPHTPRRLQLIFEDSPSCLNFGDPGRPHPCSECWLMTSVPEERRNESLPCRFIPLTDQGKTTDYFYRYGTQLELEEALAGWLRKEISRIEAQGSEVQEPAAADQPNDEFSKWKRERESSWSYSDLGNGRHSRLVRPC